MRDFTICEVPVGLGKTYIKLKGQQALEIPRLAYECIGEILRDNNALQMVQLNTIEAFEQRMRKLGIEVGE